MKTYRVFTTRHYIAVEFYDVVAETPKKAQLAARLAVRKLKPNVRGEAVDNGWHSENVTEIPKLGHGAAPFDVKQVFETKYAKVYQGKY